MTCTAPALKIAVEPVPRVSNGMPMARSSKPSPLKSGKLAAGTARISSGSKRGLAQNRRERAERSDIGVTSGEMARGVDFL